MGILEGGSEEGGRGPAPATAEPSFASSWRRRRLTVEERVARGRSARVDAPRSGHAEFRSAPDRADVVAILEEQHLTRLSELVPVRVARMATSPFAFFRGAALVMAGDLAPTPTSRITVQLCGDAHLSNFGVFGTPERKLVFDINDFDETLPGPWEWDLKRLVASFEILGRERGFPPRDRRDLVEATVRSYRERMREAAAERTLEVWYQHLEAGQLLAEVAEEVRRGRLARREARGASASLSKALTRDNLRVFTRQVGVVEDQLRIVADPPLIVPIEDLVTSDPGWQDPAATIKALLAGYRRTLGAVHHPVEEFRYVHAARKVVGVGSVGTRCYIVLLTGRDNQDPLILQVKEAQPSVLERFLGPSPHAHHGQRVVEGQRLMQAASDIFLGWQRIQGLDGTRRDYYARQLHDWKGGADPERMSTRSAAVYARICGATLARAHARWGDRIAIASYLGGSDRLDRALAGFASRYADQNQRDYERLLEAVRSGRLPAAGDD